MTRQYDSDKDDETRQAHRAGEADASSAAASSGHKADDDESLTPYDSEADMPKAVANAPRKRGRIVLWGVGAGIIVLLGGLGWNVQRQQATQQQLDQVGSELSALRNNSLARSALDQAVAPLNERLQALGGAVDVLQKRLADNRFADGRYVEIDYQLRMAVQRLSLNGDVHGALELLKSADQRLSELNEPALTPVRNALHDALARLGSVSAPDIEGIYLQLAAESHAIEALSMTDELPAAAAQPGANAAERPRDQSWWRRELANLKQDLKELVVVRYSNHNIDELLMPEQKGAVREHIRLGFSEAQAGLLRQSPEIYAHALQDVMETIRRYFPQDNEGVKQLLSRLDVLSHRAIRPELPDINGVLAQWQQALEHRQAQRGA